MPRKLFRKDGSSPRPPAPTAASPAKQKSRKVPLKVLSRFAVQLSVLTQAGMRIVPALDVCASLLRPGPFRRVVGSLARTVEDGETLSAALTRHPKEFDRIFVNLVAAAETSGEISGILTRIAEFLDRRQSLRTQLQQALAYPLSVISVAILVVAGIVGFVIPKFEALFAQQGASLPGSTRALLEISRSISANWYLLPIVPAVLIAAVILSLRKKGVRLWFDQRILRIPLFGELLRKAVVASLTRTLGTLTQSRVEILEAFRLTAETVNNRKVAADLHAVAASLAQGNNIAGAIASSIFADDLLNALVATGEQSGNLEAMLLKVADSYDQEVGLTTTNLMKFLEPALVVLLGIVVGFIVFALFSPLLQMMSTLGNRR